MGDTIEETEGTVLGDVVTQIQSEAEFAELSGQQLVLAPTTQLVPALPATTAVQKSVAGPLAQDDAGEPVKLAECCIATSTKVDLKGADFSSVDDKYFARTEDKKK